MLRACRLFELVGFQPSLQLGRDPELVRSEDLDNDPTSLSKGDIRSCAKAGVATGGVITVIHCDD